MPRTKCEASCVSVVTWVIAGPLLAFAVFTPMAGKLGDLHGHRRMYLIGFSGAAFFSLLTATAGSAFTLIGFRVLAQAFSARHQQRATPDDRDAQPAREFLASRLERPRKEARLDSA